VAGLRHLLPLPIARGPSGIQVGANRRVLDDVGADACGGRRRDRSRGRRLLLLLASPTQLVEAASPGSNLLAA